MKSTSTLLTVCLSTLLCGCALNYENVSKESEYAQLPNTRFTLNTRMYISGVNLPPGYGKAIHIYIIDPMHPSWTGPEVITRDTLQAGTIVTIQSIRRSINDVFFEGKSIQAVVAVEPYNKTVNVPIVIDLKYINSTNNYMRKVN